MRRCADTPVNTQGCEVTSRNCGSILPPPKKPQIDLHGTCRALRCCDHCAGWHRHGTVPRMVTDFGKTDLDGPSPSRPSLRSHSDRSCYGLALSSCLHGLKPGHGGVAGHPMPAPVAAAAPDSATGTHLRPLIVLGPGCGVGVFILWRYVPQVAEYLPHHWFFRVVACVQLALGERPLQGQGARAQPAAGGRAEAPGQGPHPQGPCHPVQQPWTPTAAPAADPVP